MYSSPSYVQSRTVMWAAGWPLWTCACHLYRTQGPYPDLFNIQVQPSTRQNRDANSLPYILVTCEVLHIRTCTRVSWLYSTQPWEAHSVSNRCFLRISSAATQVCPVFEIVTLFHPIAAVVVIMCDSTYFVFVVIQGMRTRCWSREVDTRNFTARACCSNQDTTSSTKVCCKLLQQILVVQT